MKESDNMKIIVTKQNADGTFDSAGMGNRALSGDYKYLQNAIKHFDKPFASGNPFRVEIFYSNLYQDNADQVLFFN